jgi:hypothetical protein
MWGLFKLIGMLAGFILTGLIGGLVVVESSPQIRESCVGGPTCYIVRFVNRVNPVAEQTQLREGASGSPGHTCLDKDARRAIYHLSEILYPGVPATIESTLPYKEKQCAAVEEVIRNICAAFKGGLSGLDACSQKS